MSILTRTYPFKQSRHWLKDSIAYGVLIWAILFLLQPFGFSMYQGNKCLVAAVFGLITTCCYALYWWGVISPLVKRVKPWRIWHNGCCTLGLIAFIAICNFLTFAALFHYPVTAGVFLMFLQWTLIIGLIMTVLSIFIDYNRSLRERMQDLLNKTTDEQRDITITIHDTNVRGNDLTIPINHLLYIEAQKNNVSACYLRNGVPTSVEIHTTLSAVVDELREYQNIFQCHRSFVVNVNNITQAKGNSNGYQLRLGTCTTIIPVSRSYVPQLKSFIA